MNKNLGLAASLTAALFAVSAFAADTDRTEDSGFVVTPVLRITAVKGDKEKFREDAWMTDKPSGGLEDCLRRQKLGNDSTLRIEGRAFH
jgi:hypothetical protein